MLEFWKWMNKKSASDEESSNQELEERLIRIITPSWKLFSVNKDKLIKDYLDWKCKDGYSIRDILRQYFAYPVRNDHYEVDDSYIEIKKNLVDYVFDNGCVNLSKTQITQIYEAYIDDMLECLTEFLKVDIYELQRDFNISVV